MDVHPETNSDQPQENPEESADTMTVSDGYRPAKVAEVLELDMGDGLILYNHDSSLVHHLNPSAALVWQLCDGQASVGQLATEISQEYGLAESDVLEQLSAVIAEFDALDLVDDARSLLRKDVAGS